jgi:hypothetical protein
VKHRKGSPGRHVKITDVTVAEKVRRRRVVVLMTAEVREIIARIADEQKVPIYLAVEAAILTYRDAIARLPGATQQILGMTEILSIGRER